MPPKKKVMQPIDRPLSRAYARDFKGWSTAEPPGVSDPTTFREMENVLINRDGSARVRPGLRYLSYESLPYDTTMTAGGGPEEGALPATAGPWEEWSMMPLGTRTGHATVTAKGKIYVCTGYRSGVPAPELEIYDPNTDTWSQGATMPEPPLSGHAEDQWPKAYGAANAAGYYKGKIYVFSASSEINREYVSNAWRDWGALYKLFVYDIESDTWETRPGPGATRYPSASGVGNQVADGKLHCFAFSRTSEWSSNGLGKGFWIYDLEASAWAPGPDYAQANGKVYHTTVAMPDGKLYQSAGTRYIDPQNNVYNPATNNWAGTANYVGEIHNTGASRHGGLIYVSGGSNSSGGGDQRRDSVVAYNPETDTYVTSTALPSKMDHHCSVMVGTTMYAVGGTSQSGKHYRRNLGGFPDLDTYEDNAGLFTVDGVGGGVAFERPFVGTHEAFYLNDGSKAYLCAVREDDGTVGFRVMMQTVNGGAMYDLQDPLINFTINQPLSVLNFSEGTTYVKYLQIDNRIFALSNNGENMRIFTVGERKEAKALFSIERPEWENADKLDIVHPEADWITSGESVATRRNRLPNPSFERSLDRWNSGANTQMSRPPSPTSGAVTGNRAVKLESLPERTNLIEHPLHDVAGQGINGWNATQDATIEAATSWLKVNMPADKGRHYARCNLFEGVEAGQKYRVSFDFDPGNHVAPGAKLRWHGANGAQLEEEIVYDIESQVTSGTTVRYASGPRTAPKGAVSARVYLGGTNKQASTTNMKFKNVMFTPADEPTTMFHGGSGADYFWTGTAHKSASVYHPPKQVMLTAHSVAARPGLAHSGSMHVYSPVSRSCELRMRFYNKHEVEQVEELSTTPSVVDTWTRVEVGTAASPANGVRADLRITIPAVPRGEAHWVDAAMLEDGVSVAGTYFDGASNDTATYRHEWRGDKHDSHSTQEEFSSAPSIPTPETRTPDTLIAAAGAKNNPYQFGFFYTFSNEVGESAASKISRQRAQRAWSEWIWETPNLAGEPSGTETRDPDRCADQLVAIMPQEVFDEGVAQGATSWALYMFTWSDQDAAPVTALKVGEKEIPSLADYQAHGWIRVTPVSTASTDIGVLPTLDNRYNYSDPSRAGQGLVVSDRMVLVNDPTAAAVIKWSSNRMGEYTNFTASQGGGYKTLTSGNLYVPAAVKLWQNPQSADTICILCLGTDGYSTSYYMAPSQIAAQSEATNVFGFEETTATPGTTSPYGVEIFNNALYHPLEDQLMKSTASNYNINHKSQTDMVRNMWEKLSTKQRMVSAQHDGRLYYLVNNPDGEALQDGCNGNEIWVLDATSKTGTWSRLMIQAHTLRKIEFGGRIYMSVIKPDGIYYLDPYYPFDDVVADGIVWASAIPWKLVTNTQGANRAHDAWCHLQQVNVTLGYFRGRMRFGIRSVDVNGKKVEMSKIVRDPRATELLAYDIEEMLAVRRDVKEWYFFAESVQTDSGYNEPSEGQVSLIQYRYTPVSVNVGYEYGSVETFEYGRDVALAESSNTVNGVPVPLQDIREP